MVRLLASARLTRASLALLPLLVPAVAAAAAALSDVALYAAPDATGDKEGLAELDYVPRRGDHGRGAHRGGSPPVHGGLGCEYDGYSAVAGNVGRGGCPRRCPECPA